MKLECDVSKTLEYIKQIREETGEKVTITHIVGKALGHCIEQTNRGNSRIVFGRFVPRESVDIAYIVNVPKSNNIAVATVRNVVGKSCQDIAKKLRTQAGAIRKDKDQQFNATLDIAKLLPASLLYPISSFAGFLSNCLGVNWPAMALTPHTFGSGYVTSLGMFGIEEAYAPLTHYSHAGFILLIGAVVDKPVVVDGEIVIRPMMCVTGTADHRYIDGAEAGIISQNVKEWIQNPEGMPNNTH